MTDFFESRDNFHANFTSDISMLHHNTSHRFYAVFMSRALFFSAKSGRIWYTSIYRIHSEEKSHANF